LSALLSLSPLDTTRLMPAQIFPVFDVDVGGLLIAIFIAIVLIYKIGWWRQRVLTPKFKADVSTMGLGARARVLGRVIGKDALEVEPLFHHYRERWALHALVFYGFIGLMITTTLDAIVNRPANPLAFDDPVTVIGNVSGLMLVIGATPMLFRKKNIAGFEPLGFSDKVFLPVLWLTAVTGFGTEILDFSGTVVPAQAIYVIHIAIVAALLISAPWTRFVHSVQTPFLAFYERIRQKEVSQKEDIDYKRLNLAVYAKDNFFPEYKEDEKKTTEANQSPTAPMGAKLAKASDSSTQRTKDE
jgi:hypothetical protein